MVFSQIYSNIIKIRSMFEAEHGEISSSLEEGDKQIQNLHITIAQCRMKG